MSLSPEERAAIDKAIHLVEGQDAMDEAIWLAAKEYAAKEFSAEGDALHTALREWGIETINAGYRRRCQVCDSKWERGDKESHSADCLARPKE